MKNNLEKKRVTELLKIMEKLDRIREKHWDLQSKLRHHLEMIDDSHKRLYSIGGQAKSIIGKRKGEQCPVRQVRSEKYTRRDGKESHITEFACALSEYGSWRMGQNFHFRCADCKIPAKERVVRAAMNKTFNRSYP